MTSLHDIAPRLACARDAERAYQARKAAQHRRGYYTFDVACEEMFRTARAFTRSMRMIQTAAGASTTTVERLCVAIDAMGHAA